MTSTVLWYQGPHHPNLLIQPSPSAAPPVISCSATLGRRGGGPMNHVFHAQLTTRTFSCSPLHQNQNRTRQPQSGQPPPPGLNLLQHPTLFSPPVLVVVRCRAASETSDGWQRTKFRRRKKARSAMVTGAWASWDGADGPNSITTACNDGSLPYTRYVDRHTFFRFFFCFRFCSLPRDADDDLSLFIILPLSRPGETAISI